MLQRLTTSTLFLVLILFVSMLGVNEASAAPSPPDTFTTSGVTSTSWTVSWSGGPGFSWKVIGYSFRSRKQGTSDWTYVDGAPFINTSLTFTGSPSTTYEYQVQTLAKNEAALLINLDHREWSSWSTAQEVTTKGVPKTVGTISDQTLKVGAIYPSFPESVLVLHVSSNFTHSGNDTMTYSATLSDTSIGTLSVIGSTLTITAVDEGSGTVTVTATDSLNATATQTFSLKVLPNSDPAAVGTIPAQTVSVTETARTVDVSSYFSDPDGNPLTYSAASSDTSIATASVSEATVSITGVATGSATITVTATDTANATATQNISVTIIANRAPVRTATIPTQTVSLSGSAVTVDLGSYFSDPDGNPLTYSATSSNVSKATVSVSGSTLTITAVATGSATITVNATDPSNAGTQQSFSVSVVSNRSPISEGTIPNQTVRVGGTAGTVDLSSYFSDPDGNPLTYSATSSNTSKATVSVSGSTLTITAVAAGSATINVTATDTSNASRSRSFSATVLPNNKVIRVGTIPNQTVALSGTGTATVDVSSYFSGPVGETLTYSATSSSSSKATVSMSGSTLTITGAAAGSSTIRVTATSSENKSATQSFSVTVYSNRAPTTVGTISDKQLINGTVHTWNIAGYFSDPDGNTLTYTASSSNETSTGANIGGAGNSTLILLADGLGTATVTVTATDPSAASATQSFSVTVIPDTADALPGLSSEEQALLGSLLTYDTLIFNELHNGSDDAADWLELRNISAIDIPLDNWQLSVQTGSGTAVFPFLAGTVIPAGEVLLLTNTEITTAAVVIESFVLPQTEFALILRSPTAFGDLAGNYFQSESERPETAPELTVDTVWERVQATVSGYRAEAWAASKRRNGLGSPGYHPSALTGDLNHDGVVNILDLVLVASQLGTIGFTAADLNGDNTVNIQDLVLVANALDNVATAPSAKQPTAALIDTWLQLARQNGLTNVQTSLPEGFSYGRGIQALEQLARALAPDKTALLANYPNPFNPETWIPYQLSRAADVTVTIYASDGIVVRTLAIGHQDAGMYKNRSQAAYWDGKNEFGESVASGLYFYTLSAGEFTATSNMLILK